MMIYKNKEAGVFRVENDHSISHDFVIGYRVGSVDREVTFNYTELPTELMNEFAKVTNKIARYVEENPEMKEGTEAITESFYDGINAEVSI